MTDDEREAMERAAERNKDALIRAAGVRLEDPDPVIVASLLDVPKLAERIAALEQERDDAFAAGYLDEGRNWKRALDRLSTERDESRAHVALLREALGRGVDLVDEAVAGDFVQAHAAGVLHAWWATARDTLAAADNRCEAEQRTRALATRLLEVTDYTAELAALRKVLEAARATAAFMHSHLGIGVAGIEHENWMRDAIAKADKAKEGA